MDSGMTENATFNNGLFLRVFTRTANQWDVHASISMCVTCVHAEIYSYMNIHT